MSGLTVIRVRHRCCLKHAYLIRFGQYLCLARKQLYLSVSDIGAGGPEIAKSREMAWGRHSIQFPKHSAMPGVVHEPVEKTV